jgi:hypothetical protein
MTGKSGGDCEWRPRRTTHVARAFLPAVETEGAERYLRRSRSASSAASSARPAGVGAPPPPPLELPEPPPLLLLSDVTRQQGLTSRQAANIATRPT